MQRYDEANSNSIAELVPASVGPSIATMLRLLGFSAEDTDTKLSVESDQSRRSGAEFALPPAGKNPQ